MAKIQFVTDELVSFYALWRTSLESRKEVRDKIFSTFEDKKLHMLKEVEPHSYDSEARQKLSEL